MNTALNPGRPNDPFVFGWDLDEVITRNLTKFDEERRRGRPLLRATQKAINHGTAQEKMPRTNRAVPMNPIKIQPSCAKSINPTSSKDKKLNLQYLFDLNLQAEPYWPTNGTCVCDNCNSVIEPFSGVILRNCQNHNLCKPCIFKRLHLPSTSLTCPVKYCRASMKAGELSSFQLELNMWRNQENSENHRSTSAKVDERKNSEGFKTSAISSCVWHAVQGVRPKVKEPRVKANDSRFSERERKFSQTLDKIVSRNDLEKELNLAYLDKKQLRENSFWPTHGSQTCSKCRNPIKSMEGIVLKNCRKHRLCKTCVFDKIYTHPPVCPVDNCNAEFQQKELESLRRLREDIRHHEVLTHSCQDSIQNQRTGHPHKCKQCKKDTNNSVICDDCEILNAKHWETDFRRRTQKNKTKDGKIMRKKNKCCQTV